MVRVEQQSFGVIKKQRCLETLTQLELLVVRLKYHQRILFAMLDYLNINISEGGHLLLDPKNITVGDSVSSQNWIYRGLIGFDYVNTATE